MSISLIKQVFNNSIQSLKEEYVPRKKSSSISKLDPYSCHPQTKEELKEVIIERINEEGPICNLNDIDVSGITDMSYLFNANKYTHDKNNVNGNKIFEAFNGNISQWDVSNVTDMSHMFYQCRKFNGNISQWDVSNVTDMSYMFLGCKRFNRDISNWNVSNVTNMDSMFIGCNDFKYDLSNWNISKANFTYTVREHMRHINEEYIPRNSRTSISKLDSYSCHPTSKEELREIIIERINEDGPTCDLNDIDVSQITDMSNLFDANKYSRDKNNVNGNEIFEDFNCDISQWDVSNVTDMSQMFNWCVNFNGDISQWNVFRVTDMKYMFNHCENFNSDISKWNVSNVTDMSDMFCECKKFDRDISMWKVSNVTNMSLMFYDCEKFNSDISQWDVSNVTSMAYMFNGCKSFNYDLSSWDITKAENNGVDSVRRYMRHINEEYIPRQRRTSISRIDKDIPYIHFTCKGYQNFIPYKVSYYQDSWFLEVIKNLEYSLDKINWISFNENLTYDQPYYSIRIKFKDNLWIRGKSKYGTSSITFDFKNVCFVDVEGDICTLIDWENYQTCDTSQATFQGLFTWCNRLRNADKLVLSAMNIYCYAHMFDCCKNLLTPPILPSIEAMRDCYSHMFFCCEKLQRKAKISTAAKEIIDQDPSYYIDNMYTGCPCKNLKDDILNEEYVPRKSRTSISKLDPYLYHPETKEELKKIIIKCIKEKGPTCDLNDIDVSQIKDMSHLFDAIPDDYGDIGNSIFKDFNGDISQWDVSKVRYMSGMFYGCENFNSNISQWDVSNVINMAFMFFACENFNSDISQWDVSNVTRMNSMFDGCYSFNRDLSNWNILKAENNGVNSVRQYMKHINEEYIPRKRKTSISKLEPYSCHPETKEELQQIIIERIKTKGNKCNLNDIDVSNITDMSHLFDAIPGNNGNGNIIFRDFNGNISQWNVSNVTDMSCMFYGCEDFNCDISQWDVFNVTDMKWMFSRCQKFDGDISQWDVSNVRNMHGMFYLCENFNGNISNWNVSNVTIMAYMFYFCENFNRDISKWDVSKVTDMEYMFDGCYSFNWDLSSWDISKAENNGSKNYGINSVRRYMRHINEEYIPRKRKASISKIDLYSCHPKTKEELREIVIERINEIGPTCDLNDIDVSNITDMSNLFNANKYYIDINNFNGNEIFEDFNGDISKWDVSNVTNMNGIFYFCENFNCDLSMWNVSKVTSMYCMFQNCKIFDSDLSNWNVSNVRDMEKMFAGCERFNSNISQWNVSNVIDMSYMFVGCKSFNQDLSRWNISKAINADTVRRYMRYINEEYIPRKRKASISRIEYDSTPYVHFSCNGTQGFLIGTAYIYNDEDHFTKGFEYSLDKKVWERLTIENSLSENAIEFTNDLWVRGKSKIGTYNMPFRLIYTDPMVTIDGDIRTLIDWENYQTCDTSQAKFYYLFSEDDDTCDESPIIDASELELNIDLSESCYEGMFAYCKNLKKAPKLPSRKLAKSCYEGMFQFTGLTETPELPAEKLAKDCYKMMFYNCEKLVYVHELKSLYLADGCYQEMFEDCTGLERVFKELPATLLSESCYLGMFYGCSNLTIAPDLLGLHLAEACYNQMFHSCSRLMRRARIPKGVTIDEDVAFEMYKECPCESSNDNYLNEEYVPRQRRTSISNIHIDPYSCHPQTKEELREIIIKRINEEGPTCDLNDIDVSNITDMSHLFDAGGTKLYGDEIFIDFNGDISQWNVSNVTDMSDMFAYCENFDQDLSNWDVSNVTKMMFMFWDCKSFNSDISQWDVSSVTNMRGMFHGCDRFNQDLSSWNISKAKYNSSVKEHMLKHINEEYVPRQRRTSISKLDPYSCHPKTKEELREIIIECINAEGNDCDLNDIDVSNITDMSYLFNANRDFHEGEPIFMDFNGDISQWDVSNVTTMKYMFNWCVKFNGDLSKWDVSRVTDMECMFCWCSKFNSDISNWDVSGVIEMWNMLNGCDSFNWDLSNWNISKAGTTSFGVRDHMKHINEEYIPIQRRTSISKIIVDNTPYVHFSCEGEKKMDFIWIQPVKHNVDIFNEQDFEFSKDKINWEKITFPKNNGMSRSIFRFVIDFEDNLWIRAKSCFGTAGFTDGALIQINFYYNNPVKVSGDIRTLIDWQNYDKCFTKDAKFIQLFYNCASLYDASQLKLSCQDLSNDCYNSMFANCEDLKFPPKELPAKKLSGGCYKSMFKGCINLESAPDILATYMPMLSSCCDYMFFRCKKLNKKARIAIPEKSVNFKSNRQWMYGSEGSEASITDQCPCIDDEQTYVENVE